MNIEPVKKTNRVSKSSDKKQKQEGRQKNPRKFLDDFRKKLDAHRKRKVKTESKSKTKTELKEYKPPTSQHEIIYRKEVAKTKTYSRVYHTLNDKDKVNKVKTPIKKATSQSQTKSSQVAKKSLSRPTTSSRYYGTRNTNSSTISRL